MTATLTDRYVAATLRRVPDKRRPDVEREVRAAIGDGIDARVRQGQPAADAEYAALTELGDPARLAAGYAGRATALIGPATYPAYISALRGVCWTVLPVVAAVLVIVYRAHGDNAWVSISRPIGVTLTVAMYLLVCVTVLFALVDRDRDRGAEPAAGAEPWTPDRLPAVAEPRPAGWGDVIGVGVTAAVLIAVLFLQRTVSPVHDSAGSDIPIIRPALWDFWVPYFIAVLVLAVVLGIVNVRLRGWNRGTAVAATVLALVGTVPLAWLFARAKVLNHALAHGKGGALVTSGSWIAWLAILLIVVIDGAVLFGVWRNVRAEEGMPRAS
ncbi:permease prefix domain 1-containing protein [Actinomadura verrucosospora]|uniref:NADPH:quinone reductase-like protein n=1 Tax=Actinomadura verrucosospora TaxID=46165 RepID=A0A7D3ZZW7_ACTVE|nr:permease prefix domain 1-containing protein [Actinomadura verrucosospora]QKG19185.1 NADPH:quinone reductase-like protein [Actinomadura verrucosospora]